MTKSELIDAVATACKEEVNRKLAENVIDAVFETMGQGIEPIQTGKAIVHVQDRATVRALHG